MVKTLLKDYNEIEEHKKSQLPQTLTTISEVKENNINPEQNILEKSKNLVDGVVSGGGVKAEAKYMRGPFGMEADINAQWWGVDLWLNEAVMRVAINGMQGGLFSFIWSTSIPVCIYVALPLYGACVFVIRMIASVLAGQLIHWIKGQNWWCNRGIRVRVNYNRNYSFKCN